MSRLWKSVFLLAITIAAISTGATKYTAGGGYYGEAGTSYSGSLSEYKGYATVSIPFRGTVNANQLEECDFRMDDGEIVVYGYNTRNGGLYERSEPLIHGTRGNIVAVEDDCQFSINTDEDIEPLDDSVNRLKGTPQDGWLLYSPVNDRDVSGLESAVAASGQNCDLTFVDGNPTYRFTLDGNDPLGGGDTMQSDRTYWVGTTGFGCRTIDFGDIPPPTVENPEDATADSGSETDDPASDPVNGGGSTDSSLGTESGGAVEGVLKFELFDADGDRMSGGSINVEGVPHSNKEFSSRDGTSEDIEVSRGKTYTVSVTCNEAELQKQILLESDTRNIELLLDRSVGSPQCRQYGGDFSEKSRGGDYEVIESNPDTEQVTPQTAHYEFSLVNGDTSKSFEDVNDLDEFGPEIDSLGDGKSYDLIFKVDSYRDPRTIRRADVLEGKTIKLFQPDDSEDQRTDRERTCERGDPSACAIPRYAENFEPGKYTIRLYEDQRNPNSVDYQERIAESTIVLPDFPPGGP